MGAMTDKNLSRKRRRRKAASQKDVRPQAAATHKSKNPKRKSLVVKIVIAVLIIGGLGAGVFLIGRHFNGAWAAQDAISASIARIEEADTAIVKLNNTVTSTVDEASQADTDALIEDVDATLTILIKADEQLARANALDEFLNENELAICDALRDSIDARREMVKAGEAIVSVDATVGNARSKLDQAVEKALEADEKSREATEAANSYAQFLAGDDSVATKDANSVVDLDNRVIELVNEAKGLVGDAKEAFGDADYSAYETYLDKRAEAAQRMLEADSALVSGDFASVSDLTNKYNEADAAAIAAASALPTSTSEVFSAPYEALTAEQRKAYSTASTKAADADILIRHYQGINVSTLLLATTTSSAQSGEAPTTDASASVIEGLPVITEN